MSKFCSSCGNQCADNAAFCNACGTRFPAQTPPQQNINTQQNFGQSVQPQNYQQQGYQQNYQQFLQAPMPNGMQTGGTKSRKGLVAALIIIFIAIAIIAGAVILLFTLSKPYKKGLDNFFEALEDGDSGEIIRIVYYEPIIDAVKKEYPDQADQLEEMMESSFEVIYENFEEEFGKDYKITYKVVDSEKLNKGDISDIEDSYKDAFDMVGVDAKTPDIDRAYKVELEMYIEGDDDEDDSDAEITLFEVDGEWYVDVTSMDGFN